ncbi:hypothetical protein LLG46_14110 [bacterium]|nr:hypothetical protein [bacterium]
MNNGDSHKEIHFTWTDAWLLQAIAMAARKQPATIEKIIAAGDAIMHAVFTFEEFGLGLAKLTTGGYVAEEAGKFQLSPHFSSAFMRLARQARSWREVNETLLAFLVREYGKVDAATKQQPGPSLSLADFEEAVIHYIHPTPTLTRLMNLFKRLRNQN